MSKSFTQAPITVIIPCYRCESTIHRALDSVLAQTLQPAEILLIDDFSEDGTTDILRKLEVKHARVVRLIEQKKNGGPGLARNVGWEAATQTWLAFLDADDVWHPRKLEIQWSWLLANPEVVLCGHMSRFSEDGQLNHPVQANPPATRLTLMKMLVSNRIPTRSVVIRRDLLFRFGGREVTEDYLLWLEVIASGGDANRLEACLAYSLRPEFSPGGYSGNLWAHEKRELNALRALYSLRRIHLMLWVAVSTWSMVKYLRRRWIVWSSS